MKEAWESPRIDTFDSDQVVAALGVATAGTSGVVSGPGPEPHGGHHH